MTKQEILQQMASKAEAGKSAAEMAAELIGQPAESLGNVQLLNASGVATCLIDVALHTTRYTGESKLTAEDLGLDNATATALQNTTALGTKYVLPKSLVNRQRTIDTRARQAIARHSVALGNVRLVPTSAIDSLDSALAEIETEWANHASVVAETRDEWIREQRAEYTNQANAIAGRLIDSGNLPESERAEFCNNYVARIFASVPDADSLRAAYTWNVRRRLYVLPSISAAYAAASLAAESDARLQAIAAEAAAEAEAEAREQATKLRLAIVADLGGRVLDKITAAMMAIESTGKISGRTVHSLRVVAADVDNLNAYGLPAAARIANECRAIGDIPTESREPFEIADRLRAIALLAIGMMAEAGCSVPDYSHCNLPATITENDSEFIQVALPE
jgi:hypothetical protein